ncbi:MAG: baseplate J/gp47 family protein [Anaerotignum sp.]|nr:baseplate J/gp47 family protein [Anaerotignum sp.]MBR5121977.1 baseplate J/gp47 family protein [Anaerotignum sp.]
MYDDITYESLKEEMLQEITLTDKREGSYVNDMISTSAMEGEKAYAALRHVISIFFKQDAKGEYADKFAGEYGIVRKMGTKAEGEVTFTGEPGAVIPSGTMCTTASGLVFLTTVEGTIGEDGTVTVPAIAENVGDNYNILAGYINTLPVAIKDVTAVTNARIFVGGTDVETDEELMERLLLRLRTPATSGNKYHYMQWALEVNGVGDAQVFPLENGPGTVGVMPITSGGRAPDQDILDAVYAHIEEQRPIGATVRVYAPSEVMITVNAGIEITSAVSLESVTAAYKSLFAAHIRNGVFKENKVDYYYCLSMFYNIPGVVAVRSFALNGGTANINIGAKQIQVAGEVTITEVEPE